MGSLATARWHAEYLGRIVELTSDCPYNRHSPSKHAFEERNLEQYLLTHQTSYQPWTYTSYYDKVDQKQNIYGCYFC
eukprot:6211928-Pleurochrysis_carterae.AAC.1